MVVTFFLAFLHRIYYIRSSMKRLRKIPTFIILCVFLTTGCATITGPSVSKEEIKAAKEGLEIKSLEFRLKQIKRVNEIGYNLVKYIPEDDIKGKPRPFLGLFTMKPDKINQRLYGEVKKGVFVVFVLEDSPVGRAGLQPGDVVLEINAKRILKYKNSADSLLRKLEPGAEAILKILRDAEPMEITVPVEELPVAWVVCGVCVCDVCVGDCVVSICVCAMWYVCVM